MKKDDLWEAWVGRRTKDGIEIAFGHHRLAAAIELFGKNHKVSVQIAEDDSDGAMKRKLVNENNKKNQAPAERIASVVLIRKHLIAHPEDCVIPAPSAGMTSKQKSGASRHEHGSSACISAFLGSEGWSERTVAELLDLEENADLSLIAMTAPPTGSRDGGHGRRKGELSQRMLRELKSLPKQVQKAVGPVIADSEADVGEVRRITDEIKRTKDVTPKQAARIARDMSSACIEVDAEETADFVKQFNGSVHLRSISKSVLSETIHTAEEIVASGHRTLAMKRHPDHGGTEREMQILNSAAQWLRTLIKENKAWQS